jgi:ABC-2 type transport system permease protein
VSATSAIARRAFADGRTRTISFALLFAFVAVANVAGFQHGFSTLKDRLNFARSFGGDASVRLFYGEPHELLTAGGYVAWRVGGLMSIFAAVWGLLAAVRALRTEEDAGRWELILAGTVRRRQALLAALAAIVAGIAVLWLATFLGLILGGLRAGGSAYLALAPARRVALELGIATLALMLILRVIADTSAGAGWLRWATPLGWSEELRAFANPQPAVLFLPLLASVALLVLAAKIALRRDIGSGLIEARDRTAPRLWLLSSPTALALRGERGSLAGWLFGVGGFAAIIGVISTTFTTAKLPENLRRELARIGGATITTPTGVLGLYFLFFVLVVSLFACGQIAAARHEEAGQQLETLLALPVGRRKWLTGRLALALGGSIVLAFSAALLAWAGARSQGASVSLPRMLQAGANCLPATLLFLSLSALTFAALPRATSGIAYGLVSVAFVWQLFGSVLGAPAWLLGISPFHHVGLVPAQPFKGLAAAIMLLLAAAGVLAAFALFQRRDLTGH